MANRHRRKTPQYYYNAQKQKAKARGIAWEFTDWKEWFAVWDASGKWEQRGKGLGMFVMARKNDVGPYSPDNVIIQEDCKNSRDGMTGWYEKKKADELEKSTIVKPVVVVQKSQQVVPVEQFKIQKPAIEKALVNKKENTWSWENLMREAFPRLSQWLKV